MLKNKLIQKISKANLAYPDLDLLAIPYISQQEVYRPAVICNLSGLIVYSNFWDGDIVLPKDKLKVFVSQIQDYDFQSLDEVTSLLKLLRRNGICIDEVSEAVIIEKIRAKQFPKKSFRNADLWELESVLQRTEISTTSRKYIREAKLNLYLTGQLLCSVQHISDSRSFLSKMEAEIFFNQILSFEKLFQEIYVWD